MNIKFAGLNVYLGMVALACILSGPSNQAHAGTLNGMDEPSRVSGTFIVVLKPEHIVSLNNPALTNTREIATKSLRWQAAKAAADTEVAQMVNKLSIAHPNVRVSGVMSRGKAPGFVLKASDEEAQAIANEDDVAEVDADVILENVTLNNNQTPAPSWGLKRIDQLPTSTSPSSWINAYNWIATGAGVHVYILDSGIMTTNVDFGERATNDADFVADGNPGWCASNINGAGAGHGTEVASIAGGTTYGVAKLARLHSVRIADCNANSTTATILQGLQWIYNASKNQSGIAVVNISLQWIRGTLNPVTNLSPALQAFVAQSNTWLGDIASANVGIVIAAGNNGPTDDPGNSWPQNWNSYNCCHAPNFALVVGATALNSDNIWPGTSLGSVASGDGLPNIFAPGDQVTTAWISSTTATTSSQSGTSLAAPYVTGVMALASQVSASTADGCDFTLACVVEFSGYQGLVKGNLRGALNFEVSSLVPGNFAPATATATPGGGGASGSGVSSPKVAATISIISTLLLSSP